jgi:hypothetical protein
MTKRFARRATGSTLVAVLMLVLTSGAADARIAVNHNEN